MNRRNFFQSMAGVTAAAAASPMTGLAQTASAMDPGKPGLPPYSLSVMLWTVFRGLPFEQRMARVAEAGYNQIELVGEYAGWKEADFALANKARHDLGIRFDATAGLKHGVGDPAGQEAFLAELAAGLKPMETLGCPAMIVLSGDVIPGVPKDKQHASCIETLKRAAAMVEGRQIEGRPVQLLLECIHVEENPHYYLTSAIEAMEIVREVNHPQVRFLYDLYHEQMGFGNLIEKLDKNIDIIGLIHVADVPGRREPGTGEINHPNIYRKLAQLGYKHTVAMEFLPTGDEVTALRAARKMALAG